MTGKDKWYKAVVKIWTAKPLTDEQTRMLQDAVDNALMKSLKQSFATNIKRYKETHRLRKKRREPQ